MVSHRRPFRTLDLSLLYCPSARSLGPLIRSMRRQHLPSAPRWMYLPICRPREARTSWIWAVSNSAPIQYHSTPFRRPSSPSSIPRGPDSLSCMPVFDASTPRRTAHNTRCTFGCSWAARIRSSMRHVDGGDIWMLNFLSGSGRLAACLRGPHPLTL